MSLIYLLIYEAYNFLFVIMLTQVLCKKLADSFTKNHDNVLTVLIRSIIEFMYASSIVILETPELCALFHAGDQKSLQFIQF